MSEPARDHVLLAAGNVRGSAPGLPVAFGAVPLDVFRSLVAWAEAGTREPAPALDRVRAIRGMRGMVARLAAVRLHPDSEHYYHRDLPEGIGEVVPCTPEVRGDDLSLSGPVDEEHGWFAAGPIGPRDLRFLALATAPVEQLAARMETLVEAYPDTLRAALDRNSGVRYLSALFDRFPDGLPPSALRPLLEADDRPLREAAITHLRTGRARRSP